MISTAPSIAYTVATARCRSPLVLRLLMLVSRRATTATVEVDVFWAHLALDAGAAFAGEAWGWARRDARAAARGAIGAAARWDAWAAA